MKHFLLIVCLLVSFSIHAQRSYRNDFLNVGAGARGMAIAGSMTANADDETAGFWNPAGLQAISSKYSVGLMHAEYFAGLSKYDFASFAYKSNDSTAFALSFIRTGTDDIPNTLELYDDNGNIDYSRISYFSAADYALFLSFSRNKKSIGLSYGAQAKIIYRHLGPFANAYGFGFDAGLQYRFGKWQTGAMLKDATSTFNAWFFDTSELEEVFLETGNEIPRDTIEFSVPQLNTGLARNFTFNEHFSLMSEIGFIFTFDGQRNSFISTKQMAIEPHIGFEGNYNDLIFLRAGVGKFSFIPDFDKDVLVFEPSLGLGLKLYSFRIDYALTNIANASGALYSNIFSLGYEFN
jgi:hypothetical protein